MTVCEMLLLPPRDQLGRIIRYMRRCSGMTLRGFAAAGGVSKTSIRKYEQGLCQPHPDILRKLWFAAGGLRCCEWEAVACASEEFVQTLNTKPAQYWRDRAAELRCQYAS